MRRDVSVRRKMDGIAGIAREPVYANKERGGSAVATTVRQALLDAEPLATLSGAQLDHLERVLSAGLAAVREQQFLKCLLLRTREWRKRGPGLDELGAHQGSWLDHLSRLILHDGRTYYRSEPYRIGSKALRELVALEDDGWDVCVRPELSTHFPGSTTAVIVTKKDDSAGRPEQIAAAVSGLTMDCLDAARQAKLPHVVLTHTVTEIRRRCGTDVVVVLILAAPADDDNGGGGSGPDPVPGPPGGRKNNKRKKGGAARPSAPWFAKLACGSN